MSLRILIAALALAAPVAARASTDAAWSEFRADVAARCLAQARTEGMKAPRTVVHPWGTPAHGVAVLIEGADKRICVYDKQTKTAELTPAT
ncbi:MAG TPA: hypothetical protein VFW47_16240 [Phenylobacterium sp.]|nr:hypothetical protein [Phenylobacterium sp.]